MIAYVVIHKNAMVNWSCTILLVGGVPRSKVQANGSVIAGRISTILTTKITQILGVMILIVDFVNQSPPP